jgi:hypothetical protein
MIDLSELHQVMYAAAGQLRRRDQFRVSGCIPVGPEAQVGLFFWAVERSVEALRLCREVVADLPRNATALIVGGLSAPPAPFAPEQHHFTLGNALVVVGFPRPNTTNG